MPIAPDFRLYHSNALDVLAGVLARQVAQLPADGDWLRPDVVLVPQFSMRRWLQQALAEHSGICANLRFLTPGEFVDLALEANLGPAPAADRLAPESLRWQLLQALQEAPPAALAGFVGAADPLKAWSLAGALADTYEKYQAWRRDWLLHWERGSGQDDDWQAALWRRVARGRAHRARRIGEYLQRFGATSAAAPRGLPPRLFVFACQNVSPDVLQLIASQARAGEQHFYLHTPSRAFWGDLDRWAAGYVPADDDLHGGDNPLLAAWGHAGRDFIAALGSGEAVRASFELTPFVEPSVTTLLGRLQADVLDNRAPLAAIATAAGALGDAATGNAAAQAASTHEAWPRAQVDRADASLQFHACHTRLREVQVLHDHLRALLEAAPAGGDPPLQSRDIAVLAPDIDAYAPHIEAVFGGALGSPRELPYTIADASPLASTPLAEAFLRVLALPLRPLTVSDMLDLLAVPAVAARFGVDDNDRGALQGWLEAAGARWGLDGADRARFDPALRDGDAADRAAYTFEFALDRLLLGLASGADADIAGVAAWPELEGQAALALDALLRLLAVLRAAAARLHGPQPPAAWVEGLSWLTEALFADDDESGRDAGVLKRLRECIAGFGAGAALAGYTAPVAHAVVLEQLRSELSASDARAPFLSGGICFGRMVPMRLIPFKVICVLGLDEDAFPGRDGHDPVNRIAQQLDGRQRRVGDPSRRDADRYLFLQLFASAGRVFYLSWLGMDPRDGSVREPSALVTELLDVAARYHGGDAEAVRAALVVRHALQPFSPAAFGAPHAGERLADGATTEPRRFSFDARWREAAGDAGTVAAEPAFAGGRPLTPREDDTDHTLSLQRLRSALLRPHAAYLQDGLGLRLPEDEPPLLEHEPFGAPEPLAMHALREAVFARWLREARRPELAPLHAALRARALLAPGADGRATLAALLDELAPLATLALELGFSGDDGSHAFAADVAGTQLQGTLDGVQRAGIQPAGLLRVTLRPHGRHGGHVLRHGVDRLIGSLADLPLHEVHFDRKGGQPQHVMREALEPRIALAALRSLVALRQRALREPLPFLPKSGYAYYQALLNEAAANAAPVDGEDDNVSVAGLEAARRQWQGDGDYVFAEASPATRLALRGRDPFERAVDGDRHGVDAFAATARAVFEAVEQGLAFDAGALA